MSFKGRVGVTDRIIGKRVKRRMGKAEQCRSYYCRHCEGWHLTSREDNKNFHSRRKEFLDKRSIELDFIKSPEEVDEWKEDSLPFPEQLKTNTNDNLSNQVDPR